jgi:hypothetical protein
MGQNFITVSAGEQGFGVKSRSARLYMKRSLGLGRSTLKAENKEQILDSKARHV